MLESSAYSLASPASELLELVALPRPRHLKLTGAPPAFGFERCEDVGCTVDGAGTASSCGRLACPSCGCGGTNLEALPLLEKAGSQIRCTCGHAWIREDQQASLPARLAVSL